MQKWSLNRIRSAAAEFLKKTAQKPYRLFFVLIVVFAAYAVYIFLSVQKTDSLATPQKQGLQSGLFNAAKARTYRAVFETIRQRQENYDRAAGVVYPDAFNAAPAPDLNSTTTAAAPDLISEPALELTNPEN